MARRDSDIRGRPRNSPIISCCNQRQVTVISPPVYGMHLTLKKQVINSCYPGWHLILLAFIFRRGERFILEELWLLVQDTVWWVHTAAQKSLVQREWGRNCRTRFAGDTKGGEKMETPPDLGCVSSCGGAHLTAFPVCCSSAAQDPSSGKREPCGCLGVAMPSAASSSMLGARRGRSGGARGLLGDPSPVPKPGAQPPSGGTDRCLQQRAGQESPGWALLPSEQPNHPSPADAPTSFPVELLWLGMLPVLVPAGLVFSAINIHLTRKREGNSISWWLEPSRVGKALCFGW